VTLSCFDLLVGDVLLVEAGDILPADGLLYAGGALKCAVGSRSSSSTVPAAGVSLVHACMLQCSCMHARMDFACCMDIACCRISIATAA
jgi:hypothetical protein